MSSAVCCKVSHDSTVKTWSLWSSGWCGCLGDLDSFIVILLVSYVCLELSSRESGSRHVHRDRLVIHAPWCVGQVILWDRRCCSLLVLVSSIKETGSWLLGSEHVLEHLCGRVVSSSTYPFNELFRFSSLYGMIFDIVVCRREGWFHHIFEYRLGETFQEEVDCFFIPYGISGKAC